MFESFQAFYESDAQGLYALIALPSLFLVYLLFAARPAPGAPPDVRFVWLYCVIFSVQTLLDPLCTGPLAGRFSPESWVASALPFAFVLLGDFRVFVYVFHLSRRDADGSRNLRSAVLEAAGWTLLVPILSRVAFGGLGLAMQDPPARAQWLLYELGFCAVALWLRSRVIPSRAAAESAALRATLRRALTYVCVYYALWASADVLILFAGLDAGWLLRALPNQLYYAFWVPFVFFTFAPRAPGASPR